MPLIHRRIITLPPVRVISVPIILLNLAGLAGILMAMPLVPAGSLPSRASTRKSSWAISAN